MLYEVITNDLEVRYLWQNEPYRVYLANVYPDIADWKDLVDSVNIEGFRYSSRDVAEPETKMLNVRYPHNFKYITLPDLQWGLVSAYLLQQCLCHPSSSQGFIV